MYIVTIPKKGSFIHTHTGEIGISHDLFTSERTTADAQSVRTLVLHAKV